MKFGCFFLHGALIYAIGTTKGKSLLWRQAGIKKDRGCNLESLGEYLKNKREDQNTTLEEVAQATRIRKTILEALENDRYDLLPPKVFAQGFIKSYASHLGLDENEAIKRYYEAMELEEEKKVDAGKEHAAQKTPFRLFSPARLIVLAIIMVVAFNLWFFTRTREKRENVTEKAILSTSSIPAITSTTTAQQAISERQYTSSIPHEVSETVPLESEPYSLGKEQEKETSVTTDTAETEENVLRIDASEQVWMRIQLDQKEPFEALLKSGESLTLRARNKFTIKIGNAGGVELFLNEKPLGSPGKIGEVVNLTLPE